MGRPQLSMCSPLACTCWTFKQSRALHPENPLPPSLRLASQQDEALEVVKSTEGGVGAAVHDSGFNATAFKRMDIKVRNDQIQDGQHPPRDVTREMLQS